MATGTQGTLERPANDLVDVIDLDSHEMVPMHMWAECFGDEAASLVQPLAQGLISRSGPNSTVREDISGDTMEINYETVWCNKGPDTPSAIDLARRPAVMDAMGIKRQFVFPTFGLIGLNLYHNRSAAAHFGFDPEKVDQRKAGQAAIDGYNRWAARVVRDVDGDRLRPVAIIRADSVEDMLGEAEKAIDTGLRGMWIPALPPAGLSPADTALDPFWSLAEKHNVPVVMHLGTEFASIDPAWYANIPQFSYGTKDSLEFPVEPFRASALHFPIESFLTAMIFGGVFERFPGLRFGVIECGAQWVAPMADKLDMWFREFSKRLLPYLSIKPSQYIARNIRVTPFHFEPFAEAIKSHPHLASVYAYGSDFPHIEGGMESKLVFQKKLEPLGPDAIRKFFFDNGELLLPA